MSLSRISLVPILVATGLVLLIGCKKEEAPATETTATATTATSTTAPTESATTATTATGTTGTTATTGSALAYGPQTTKLNAKKFGTIDDEHVKVTFGPNNEVTADPNPAEINSLRLQGGTHGTITWTATQDVELYVNVVKPKTGPPCIDGKATRVSKTEWTAKANPAIQHMPKTTKSVLCEVQIWKAGMTQPIDPEVVVDNCCP